ncbi:MAG TPA: hypothetical protein VJY54_10135 [Lachnospiraceae bacterium]|nr:hypothetical protein [Lachnospiraceae bacterium]
MGRVILCTGEYASSPYQFENIGVKVYSAEELCYVLKENAFLLDREIVNKKLVRWIDECLGLPELSGALYPLLHQKTSVGAFAGIILHHVKFYDRETIRSIEEIYRKSANLNAYEKMKTRVDYMVSNGRYAMAIVEYEALLNELPKQSVEMNAKVLHNKAVAMCGLFLFKEAAETFMRSYRLQPSSETLISYLAAKRLSMEEGDYITFAAGVPEYYEETLELEKRVEELRKLWDTSSEKAYLDMRISWKENANAVKYYEETEEKVQELKNNYRICVGY